jgi:hypothetical protein
MASAWTSEITTLRFPSLSPQRILDGGPELRREPPSNQLDGGQIDV